MSLETVVVSIVAGIGTGVVSSFAVWWWLARRMRPNVAVCPTLASFVSADGGRRTQFRIYNAAARDAYEVSVRVSLRMPGLIAPGVIEWLPIRQGFVAALPAGRSRRWSIHPERAEDLETYRRFLPEPLQDRLSADEGLPLAEVFAELPQATLRVSAFATDAYSGTRGYHEVTFSSSDIRTGRFLGEGCEHAPTDDWLRGDPRRKPR